MEEPRILFEESLRVYEKKTEMWKDGSLCAKSDGTVQCKILDVRIESSSSVKTKILTVTSVKN